MIKTLKNRILLYLVALLLGAGAGLIDTIFALGLAEVSDLRYLGHSRILLGLPVIGLLIIFGYRTFSPKAQAGMHAVFTSFFQKDSSIPLALIPLLTLSTWLTHLFGGSAGREGVAVQLGATLGDWLSRKFSFFSKQDLLIMGVAAGFSGLFQCPLAATFFALELFVAGHLYLRALCPTLIASFSAYWLRTSLTHPKTTYSLLVPSLFSMSISHFLALILLGILCALVGLGFSRCLSFLKKTCARICSNPYWRIGLGGIVLMVLLILAHHGRYAGLGTNLIDLSLHNGTIFSYDWLLKLILTCLTLSIGFQGGEVTPLLSIGASFGAFMGPLLGLPVPMAAALGYVAVFSSASNTLLGPIFMAIELFDPQLSLYALLVVTIAYAFNHNESIYTDQKVAPLLSFKKF